jgi:hypothetical protein
MLRDFRKQILVCAVSGLLVLGTGCKSIGPKTIPRDRFDYSSALAESWKNQMLLNIVKVRYLDLPIFLDVGQVVSGYTLETTGNLGGQLSSSDALLGNRATMGAGVRYTNRPTITLHAVDGGSFSVGVPQAHQAREDILVDPIRLFG